MWKTVIILGCSIGAVLATPVGRKNMPILAEDEMQNQKSEMAMTTLNLPSNATSIRADITDGFTCTNKTYGYYADVENECQIFHVCLPVVYPDGRENTFRWSFICPEETLFSQESFTCVRGEDMNFDCDESEKFYELNRNFGMTPDSSMEMSSLEADMDEYYMKTDLGSSALTKISEDIIEQDLPLIKPVEKKKPENQQHMSPVKPHKAPLRTTTIKPKPEPTKKPTGTSTTKRVYTKNYNKVRRPVRPQNLITKTPQQIHIELPTQTSKYEHSTTMKSDIKKPIVAIQKQEPQKLVHDVEEVMVTKIMDNFQKGDDVSEHDVQILSNDTPVVIEEMVQNLENPKQDENGDKKINDNNEENVQNIPIVIQNVKEEIKTQPLIEEEVKIEPEPELAVAQLIKEETEKVSSIPEEIKVELEETKLSENEDTAKPSAIPESTIEDMVVLESNSKTHINGQLHTTNQNEEAIQTENMDNNSEKEIVDIKDEPLELESTNNHIITPPEADQENLEDSMSSQEQEEMIVKTITDLMNAANLMNTEKLTQVSEEATTIPNMSSVNDAVETNKKSEDQIATETSPEIVTEEKVTPNTGVQLNEESLTIPESNIHNDENTEMVNEELLNKVSNSDNVESDQYSVQRPGSINSVGIEENKNELEIDNLNKGGENFSATDASSDLEAPIVQKEEDVSEPESLMDNEENIEIVESLPTQDVLDEEPLAEQSSEIKIEEILTTPVPIHNLLMSQPSQPYITLSSEMNGQFSNEQVIPVFIIQDEAMNSETAGNSENKVETIEIVKNDNLDASPQEEEEIKPIFQRIKEFHSNLLKADLLSADQDEEPAVHEISEIKEDNKSTLDKQEEKQMDVSIENLPNESTFDFLAQTDASKDFLKVMPLEIENMQTPPEPAISNLNGEETEIKLMEEIPTEEANDTPLGQRKASRILKKKMDPRKRRFLFRADTS